MRSLLSVLTVFTALVSGSQAQPPAPVPEGEIPAPMLESNRGIEGEVLELYHRVEVEDPDNIHPCAVPKIIMVPDPCARWNPCRRCAPPCVAVKICVPPCVCEEIEIKRGGRKHKYDYGEYEVEVKVERGYVKVDYDD